MEVRRMKQQFQPLKLNIIHLDAVDILTTSFYKTTFSQDIKYQTDFVSPWGNPTQATEPTSSNP